MRFWILMLAVVILALADFSAQAAVLDLNANPTRVASGDVMTLTSVVRAAQLMVNSVWSMTMPAGFAVLAVRGPSKIAAGPARMDYLDSAGAARYVLSNTVTIRIQGRTLSNRPDGSGKLTVDVGTLQAGDSDWVEVDAAAN